MHLLKKSKCFYALFGAVIMLSPLQNASALEITDTTDNAAMTDEKVVIIDEPSATANAQKTQNVSVIDSNQPTLQRALPLSYYSDQPKTDSFLTNEITEQLSLENGVDINKLTIETVDGVVSISGTATNETMIKRIIQISRSAGSVKWVQSTVTVEL